MAFAVLYNNALFVLSVLVLGFYVLNYANPVSYGQLLLYVCFTLDSNYVITIAISAALVFFNSSRQS